MHRTLKQETASPPAANHRRQQERFDHFRTEYNQERPHQAIGQKTPASLYQSSPRFYSGRPKPPEYPLDWQVRRVSPGGGNSAGPTPPSLSHTPSPRIRSGSNLSANDFGVFGFTLTKSVSSTKPNFAFVDLPESTRESSSSVAQKCIPCARYQTFTMSRY
jgi:hypothetical protein